MPSPTAPSAEVAAQVLPDSIVGRRARVRAAVPGGPMVESIGIVQDLTRDSLRLDHDRGVRSVALSPAVRLEISRGVRANTGRGAWIGALIGGLGMGTLGALSCDGRGNIVSFRSSDCAKAGALLGGAGGALVGLAIGALVRTERWQEVHPEPGIVFGSVNRQAHVPEPGAWEPGAANPTTAPADFLGTFEDDYGIRYTISPTSWQQGSGIVYHVVAWDSAGRSLIARNGEHNPSDGGRWTRIDWVRLEDMAPWTWAYCLTVYDAMTRDAAESAPAADRASPRAGCNGFPFSRMGRAE